MKIEYIFLKRLRLTNTNLIVKKVKLKYAKFID